MSKLILLVVAAAWAGVLLPPLLRSRLDSRPGASISSFRRQLSTLQRSTPGGMPMRSMARPLAGPVRGYAPGYAPQHLQRSSTVVSIDRSGRAIGYDRSPSYDRSAPLQRRPARGAYHERAVSRSLVKQRRQNVLVILAMATLAFGFLTAATTAQFARYAFVLSVCLLAGYLYLLVQIRRNEADRGRDYWPNAA